MKTKIILLSVLLLPIIAIGQRVLSRIATGSLDYPNGWPYESSGIITSTNLAPGWHTNWTFVDYQNRILALQSQMDATNTLKKQLLQSETQTRIQLLQDLFQDFQQYENGWVAGTNYNNATLQVILRKHNGALLLLKPLLKELYDSRQ